MKSIINYPPYIGGIIVISFCMGALFFIGFSSQFSIKLLFAFIGIFLSLPLCVPYLLIIKCVLLFFNKSNMSDWLKAFIVNLPLTIIAIVLLIEEGGARTAANRFERFLISPIPSSVQQLHLAWLHGVPQENFLALSFLMPTDEAIKLFDDLGYKNLSITAETDSEEKHFRIRGQGILQKEFNIHDWDITYMKKTSICYEFCYIKTNTTQVCYIRLQT